MSEPNNLLRIDRLRLQNFRCFGECQLELHPTLTVLVADNAQGKTALLDALRIALTVFVTTVGRAKQCRGFERTDIHLARGFDLRLMSIDEKNSIHGEGVHMVIVGKDAEGYLHFRIFDEMGQKVVDKAEQDFSNQAKEIEALKAQLAGLWDQDQLTLEHKQSIMAAVTSIVGHTPLMLSHLPTEFTVQGEVDHERIAWRRVLNSGSFHARSSTKNTKDIRQVAQRLADHPDVRDNVPTNPPTVLPIVAFYGTGRLYDEHRLTEGKRWLASVNPVRPSAYLDCLSPSSSYKSFSAWYGQKWDQVGDPRFRSVGFEARPENHLAAVRDAVRTVLEPTGWTTIDWEPPLEDDDGRFYRPGYLALEHPRKGRLPLTHLSDGVRNMVALVGDLAHRCVRLNPFFGEEAARRTPGIVMIDEVDMHLHPKWQQLIVGLLKHAFPNVQFVLSTHSPHVLTTVRKEHIRIIVNDEEGNWSTRVPDHSPLGQESGDALAFIMGAHPRPQLAILDDVHVYEQMARTGKSESEEARTILERLNQAGFEFTDAQKALFSLLAKKSKNPTPDPHG